MRSGVRCFHDMQVRRTAPMALRRLAAKGSLLSSMASLRKGRLVAQQAAPAVTEPAPAPRLLETLLWDHTFVNELPPDPEPSNSVRQVHGALFSRVAPTPTGTEPYLIAYSPDVCHLLSLDPTECERPEFPLIFSGSAPLPGSAPYAQCYGGHQFGQWAGQLGDGRAITLGEVLNSNGERWELQLKGAGKTPYSRFADGRAVLRSSLREYVASEALHCLGVSTTRALCLVGTGDQVYRDMFYNGQGRKEPGAIVCRVAPSFVRFGTFQLPASRGEPALTRVVADYVIRHHYSDLEGRGNKYAAMLEEVMRRTAELVAAWQAVGFVHGVLNTDNMSILGLTIDYGPFGFLDKFDPFFTPNLTDFDGKRYTYRNQPEVCQWNLVQLANSMLAADLVGKEEAEGVLKEYSQLLLEAYQRRMAAKLGLREYNKSLAAGLLQAMYEDGADFTNTFRALASIPAAPSSEDAELPPELLDALGGLEALPEERQVAWRAWIAEYQAVLRAQGLDEEARQQLQLGACPAYIPRQHLLQYSIEAAEAGDFSELERLMHVLRTPYQDQGPEYQKYRQPPPSDMVRMGVTCLSCSS